MLNFRIGVNKCVVQNKSVWNFNINKKLEDMIFLLVKLTIKIRYLGLSLFIAIYFHSKTNFAPEFTVIVKNSSNY